MTVTLAGSNFFLLKSELNRLEDNFVSEFGELALEKIDAQEADYFRVKDAVQGAPFLSSKKMVVIKGVASNKPLAEKLTELLPNVPDTTHLILVEHKPDKRTAWYKLLQSQTEFHLYEDLGQNELTKWLVAYALQLGAKLEPREASYMVERLGTDQQLLASEIEKLSLSGQVISRELIDELTEPELRSTVFNLLEKALSGNTKQVLKIYDELRLTGMDPHAILPMIIWQMHVLAVVATATGKPAANIARDSGISPYVISKAMPIVRQMKPVRLKQLVSMIRGIDVRLKTESMDADEALKYVLVSVSSQ